MDVQNTKPSVLVGINKVGCIGIKKQITRKGRVVYPSINAFVDLSKAQKGIHMSRIIESIDEVIENLMKREVSNCEDLCVDIAKELIKRQNCASSSEVELFSDFPTERIKFGKKTTKIYKMIAKASVLNINGITKVRKSIGCSAIGLNACPCAQESIKEDSARKLSEYFGEEEIKKIFSLIPLVTHNQRMKGTLIVETDEESHVELEDIVDAIENSVSSEIFEMLKRPEEAEVVKRAHENALFVEDSVRLMLKNFYNKYKYLDDAIITARAESFESIHPHNAFSECKVSIKDLREIF